MIKEPKELWQKCLWVQSRSSFCNGWEWRCDLLVMGFPSVLDQVNEMITAISYNLNLYPKAHLQRLAQASGYAS